MSGPAKSWIVCAVATGLAAWTAQAGPHAARSHGGMVAAEEERAARAGADVLRQGGTAMDAAVATAFALAVTHPAAGNIGGGGFIVYRRTNGEAGSYDFREAAPAKASAEMFLKKGTYDPATHHDGHISVGVPGTVAGLHRAWMDHGKLPWPRLVAPAVELAERGFAVSEDLARSLERILPGMARHPASRAQFSKQGVPYRAGDVLRQLDLSRTLRRIGEQGPDGFYKGETAQLIVAEMQAHAGLITLDDLKAYQPRQRVPIVGTYRGHEVISMPPPSSGGIALVQMLNILEGYELSKLGYASADSVHLMAEAMRRAFADRARFLGDPDFDAAMPVARLTSKSYAAELRRTIRGRQASQSSPSSFEWPAEGSETTHISVVDAQRNAVALTYTLEYSYGSRIVVPGAGFLLNNEMGDFNGAPGSTTHDGMIGTPPNLAGPGKRMLSSMTPTILARDGQLAMVTGSPGGRTIINTVLQTIINVVDFGMSVQQAVDAPRIHHQWLPDSISHEPFGLSPDTLRLLTDRGHVVKESSSQGVVQAIWHDPKTGLLHGVSDTRGPDGAAQAAP